MNDRIAEIEARHSHSARLLVAPAEEGSNASVYEEADGLETLCFIPDYYPAANQNVLAKEIAQLWQDREDLLAELRNIKG